MLNLSSSEILTLGRIINSNINRNKVIIVPSSPNTARAKGLPLLISLVVNVVSGNYGTLC